jgi:membrane-bound lytic murein transglycosylase F
LRVITRVEQPNYYIANGKPSGFEFEMARAFADLHGLRLEVLVARDEDQMRDWLREGMGDLITARMIGGKAEDDSLFSASRQYHYTAYAAVSRVALPTAQSLAGHQIVTVQGSPEWRAARSVDESQPNPNLVGVDAAVPSETVLEQVAAGLLDSTLIAGDDAIRVLSRYPQLKVGASIPHQYHHRWLTRRNDPLLLDASNRRADWLGRTEGAYTLSDATGLQLFHWVELLPNNLPKTELAKPFTYRITVVAVDSQRHTQAGWQAVWQPSAATPLDKPMRTADLQRVLELLP